MANGWARVCGVCAAVALTSMAGAARAAPVWTGSFETNNFSQWNFQLDPRGLSIVSTPVREGTKAARVEITSADLFSNGLNRVEVQHLPAAGRVAEGKELYFAWSFYLPAPLSSDRHQIGYWETDKTYQQLMSLTVTAQDIRFETRHPQKQLWSAKGVVTPGVWHDVVIHIKWSLQATMGRIDLWFDGEPVVTGGMAQTLVDMNPAFTQIGILRDKADAPTEIMFLDRALEGDSLADVMAPATNRPDGGTPTVGDRNDAGSGVGGAAAGGAAGAPVAGGSSGTTGGAGAPGSSGMTGSAGSGGSSGAGGQDHGAGKSSSGCAYEPVRVHSEAWWLLAFAALAGWRGWSRRRRAMEP